MTLSWSGNRLELLIVTPTLPANTDAFRRTINIHNIMDWPYPWHTRAEFPILRHI